MTQTIKDYLGFENTRNKQHAALYEALVRRAFGEDCAVLVGHHIGFEFEGKLETENEIPSADTLLFDHDLMGRIFGKRAVPIMMHLASVPCEERDALAQRYLEHEGQLPYATAPSEYPRWLTEGDDVAATAGRM